MRRSEPNANNCLTTADINYWIDTESVFIDTMPCIIRGVKAIEKSETRKRNSTIEIEEYERDLVEEERSYARDIIEGRKANAHTPRSM